MSATKIALTQFVNRAIATTESGHFSQPYDSQWLSPCESHQDGDQTFWQPVEQTIKPSNIDFSGLASAAEAPIHQDIQDFYGLYWSGVLQAKTEEGIVSLIQVWNEDDFTRLLENLVGHLFMKIRSKAPFTVFFANTEEDSEYFLSIDNTSGAILLEEPGRPPIKEVAPSLAEFLDRLEPDSRAATVY